MPIAGAIIALWPLNRHETFGVNREKRLANVTPAGKYRVLRCGRTTDSAGIPASVRLGPNFRGRIFGQKTCGRKRAPAPLDTCEKKARLRGLFYGLADDLSLIHI